MNPGAVPHGAAPAGRPGVTNACHLFPASVAHDASLLPSQTAVATKVCVSSVWCCRL